VVPGRITHREADDPAEQQVVVDLLHQLPNPDNEKVVYNALQATGLAAQFPAFVVLRSDRESPSGCSGKPKGNLL